MFGEECTLPMDVGLPRHNQDSHDPINNLYALWVRDALEVAYGQVRCHTGRAVRRQKRLYDKRAVKRMFALGDWTLRYYPPSKKCELDSPWLGPYLGVSLAGWAVGVQLHPDSQVHCQDLKKIPRPRGLTSWLQSDRPDPETNQQVIGASMVCRSVPVSTPSTVSGIWSQQHIFQAPESLPQTPESLSSIPVSLPQGLGADTPVMFPTDSVCVFTRSLQIASTRARFF